ncbi:MAG: UDP-N-acetylmuramate--L-alanine ligase [Alphaproteobacteria bacterium]|nr:UDP-N-acetylmuramate--L-alanine ligase [Alphaproteobacteria bacterium]
MKAIPLPLGTIHFIGIGGIGMSGIAEVMHNLGYSVQGSDLQENANVKRLAGLGVPVMTGHDPENLGEAAVVVVSSAVDTNNPELTAARAAKIPVVRRAEMLAELMRLKWSIAVGGTHGKTTSTSMIAAILDGAGLDPTVINGGIINAYGTNARLGGGDWMVVEADESDGTFVKLPATIAVVTNMDAEHLDFYGSFDDLRGAFEAFLRNIPFYGFAVLCIDHPEVQSLIPRMSGRRVITYGLSPQADMRAINLESDSEGMSFQVVVTDRAHETETTWPDMRLPMVGEYNVQNALGALAVGWAMGLDPDVMRKGLAAFGGVKRRFTKTGAVNGVTIIDDYAHHPVEIAAVLKAARATCGESRLIAVVQPHRYSRLLSLFEEFCTCFNDADAVIVSEVYAAGEEPLEGAGRDALIEGLRGHGHKEVLPLDDPSRLAPLVREITQPGDMVMCMGAGNSTNWATALPQELAQLAGDDSATPARAS